MIKKYIIPTTKSIALEVLVEAENEEEATKKVVAKSFIKSWKVRGARSVFKPTKEE